jgi:protocatechuate 3,4-dioxygenase beta subunit
VLCLDDPHRQIAVVKLFRGGIGQMTHMDWLHPVYLSRRTFLLAGIATVAWSQTKTPACTLTAEQEEGPYYIDDRLVRREITEGKAGIPLKLRIALVDARSCMPLPRAAIDIWHCDALGIYSGFTAMNPRGPSNGPGGPPPLPGPGMPAGALADGGPPPMAPPRQHGQVDATRYLRGVQFTDQQGHAEFATLYPGWYSGRAVHIHLKVHIASSVDGERDRGGHVCHTGQLFFPEELTADIAKLNPYATRLHVRRTLQSEDGIFTEQHGSEAMLDLTRLDKRTNQGGFLATVTLAVEPDATPSPVSPFGPGGPPFPRQLPTQRSGV